MRNPPRKGQTVRPWLGEVLRNVLRARFRSSARRAKREDAAIDRDAQGKLIWGWKKDTQPLNPDQQIELENLGLMKRDESPFRLTSADDGTPIQLHAGSVNWNEYRKRYILIGVQVHVGPPMKVEYKNWRLKQQ